MVCFYLFVCQSICLIIYVPKETWKNVFTLFHTWGKNVYSALSSDLRVVMATHTHNLSCGKAWETTWVASSSKSGSLKI